MPTNTVPTINTDTDAWRDYDATVNGGMTNADRAKARGVSAATVGANVKRIRDAVAMGATLPTGGTDTDAPTDAVHTVATALRTVVDADTYDAFGDTVTRAFNDADRAADAHARASARIDAVCTRLGIDADAVRAMVGTPIVAPTPDAG
jgi:hypothetical protein